MAQPAVTKNPLGITPFWQKASAEPPIEWDKWNQQLFLGIIAKDGMNLNKLLNNPPAVRKPQEPGYELPIDGETDKQIRDRNLRNQEKRVTWENQCQHLDNLGPTVDGIPWEEADIKCRSYIYLCLGTEGQRRVTQYYPNLRIQDTSTREFWKLLKQLFVKERNVTFDRYEAFTRKQGKTESLEEFHCGLTELVVKGNFKCTACNDVSLESEIVRDLFIAHMSNDEVQKDLLAETKTPEQALDYAIKRERGLENQVYIRKQGTTNNHPGMPNIKSEPVNFVHKRGGFKAHQRGGRSRGGQTSRNYPEKTGQKKDCFKCGNAFSGNHLAQCPARDKICNKCTKRGHFARLCKSSEVNAIQEENQEQQDLQDTDMTAYVNYLQAGDVIPGWELIHPDDTSTNWINFEPRRAEELLDTDLKGHLIRVRSEKNNIVFIADTGSPTSFVNEKTANLLATTVKSAVKTRMREDDEANRMVCYNGYKIPSLGRLTAPIESGGWTIHTASFIVVDDRRANILGRNLLPQIGIQLHQERKPAGESVCQVNSIENSDTQIATWVRNTYPGLCTRIGRSKNHMVHTQFLSDFKALQQRGRRIPIHIQEKVEHEVRSLIDQGHITRLEKCNDNQFISPIVITVKKDGSIKLAMDSKQINKSIHKNKYQMPNIDVLLDNIAQSAQEGTNKPGTTYFSTIDLRYAYSQLPLDEPTRTQCNFSIIGGKATGTYQFQTGFYGLTDMPAEFQKAIDLTLNNEKDTFAFLDDILIISHGTKEKHIEKLTKVLTKLDTENMAISIDKCKFGCREVEWLGFTINEHGTIPIHKKTDAIINLPHPKTFKQLKSFMGSVHHLNKFIPNLAQLCNPLRPLLSTANKFNFQWNEENGKAFKNVLNAVKNITENRHFVTDRDTRIVCDASREGIGAALEQNTPDGWATIAYASRFLNSCEQKYSVNELELLAAVWAIEHFKYYLYGRRFTLITDHQALVGALKSNRGNKTYQSRLTRWIDRLIPFDFDIHHLAGSKMGLIDYISRHPVGKPQPPAYWDENFVVALIDDLVKCVEFQDSSSINAAWNNVKTANYPGTKKLDRNENFARSNSIQTQTAFTLRSQLFKSSRSQINSISNSSNLKIQNNMSRQLQQGMTLPPFRRITRKAHTAAQTQLTFSPINYASFNALLSKPPPPELTFSDVTHQVIPSTNSFTFNRIESKKADAICQTLEKDQYPDTDHQTQTDNNQSSKQDTESQTIASIEDEDTPMFRKNLRKVMDISFLAAATKRDRNLSPLLTMVKQQKWDSIKSCYGPYFYNVRHRLSVRDNILLYDDRVVIPKQLRPTLMDALHLTHPGQGGMLEAAKHVWYPFIHRDIVSMAQNCKSCREKGKNFKVISGKQHFTTLDAVVEPNEEIQLDFAGPLPDENDKDVYILVGVDRFSRFPYAKVVTNNKADTIIRFMQNHIVNQGVPRAIRCDQAQGFRAKKFLIYCKSHNIKLIFAPVDDHRAIGMVERLIRTLKSRLAIMKIDKTNRPYKLASDVAELIKTLRITPNSSTKVTPFESHYGRKANTPISNLSTSPKLSNLSWENTKLSCLDEKVLAKPALSAESMWNRDINSEDELDLKYKPEHQYVPEPTFNPAPPAQTVADKSATEGNRHTQTHSGKRRAQNQPDADTHTEAVTLDSSDEEFDRRLLQKFPIGAHLPLTNKPYEARSLQETFLKEKSNDFDKLRTRNPIRLLTSQEKEKLRNAPLIFLKDRFKGPAHTVNPKTELRLEQIARKTGTIARKTKNPGTFGAQFKIIENGAIINYSPHTAWIREDGKQPRVIRHDGLAFIPDPRVYGKCRPAALKDFVAYKHLPRAKPRILEKKTPSTGAQGGASNNSAKSPRKPPPKSTQEILQQTLNRRALGPQKLLATFTPTQQGNARDRSKSLTQRLPAKAVPHRTVSPKKKARVDSATIQFDCDTSISLSSDNELDHKSPSPSQQPAAKRIDLKATPETKSPEIRRSTRSRKSTLAGKFGNAIPIGHISTNTDAPLTVATVELTSTEEITPTKLSTSNPSGENDENQITKYNEDTTHQTASLASSDEIVCTEVQMSSDTPENTRNTTKTHTIERTTSSRYILDKPQITEDSFSKDFEEAMNFLQSISPIRGNSMTFQREKEDEKQPSPQQRSTDITKTDKQQSAETREQAKDNSQEDDENQA